MTSASFSTFPRPLGEGMAVSLTGWSSTARAVHRGGRLRVGGPLTRVFLSCSGPSAHPTWALCLSSRGLVNHFTRLFMQSRPPPHREASPGGFTYRPLRSRHRTTDAPEARPSLLLLTKTQRTTRFSAPNPARAQQSPEAGTALGT